MADPPFRFFRTDLRNKELLRTIRQYIEELAAA